MRKFSIVVPVYNVELYLTACLDSIVRQTYENWELILVNDGSTDESARICADFQQRFPEKIKVVNQENRGLLLARRAGLTQVTGDFVLAVDADDLLRDIALSEIDDTLTQTSADFLFFNFSFSTDFSNGALHVPFENLHFFEGKEKVSLYHLIGQKVDFNPIWNKVVRRDLIDFETDYSIFGKKVQMGEDLLQVLPLVTAAEKIVFLNRNLYFYRINKNSMTKKTLELAHYESVKIVLEKFYEFVDSWPLPDGEKLKLQKSFLYLNERLSDVPKSDLQTERGAVKSYLLSISSDEFFRQLYQKRKLVTLTLREKLIFGLLYHRKIDLLIRLYAINQKLFKLA